MKGRDLFANRFVTIDFRRCAVQTDSDSLHRNAMCAARVAARPRRGSGRRRSAVAAPRRGSRTHRSRSLASRSRGERSCFSVRSKLLMGLDRTDGRLRFTQAQPRKETEEKSKTNNQRVCSWNLEWNIVSCVPVDVSLAPNRRVAR